MDDGKQSASNSCGPDRSWSQTISLTLLSALILAAVVNVGRGKNNQILEGVVVMDYRAYKFYSGQRDCHFTGAAYWLVPNRAFHDVVPKPSVSAFNFAHYDDALHAIWKVKLRGNLSSLGRYGVQGKYWRELDVVYVIDATELNCTDNSGKISQELSKER